MRGPWSPGRVDGVARGAANERPMAHTRSATGRRPVPWVIACAHDGAANSQHAEDQHERADDLSDQVPDRVAKWPASRENGQFEAGSGVAAQWL